MAWFRAMEVGSACFFFLSFGIQIFVDEFAAALEVLHCFISQIYFIFGHAKGLRL
jgi:hypothetical protein